MRRRDGSALALSVGEVRLPGGRMPSAARIASRARTAALVILAVVLLSVPVAAVRSAIRGDPPDAATALVTADALDGERAVTSAQRALAASPGDPRALASLALAYLQRVRETADPTYYAKADELVGRALARDASDATTSVAAASLALARHDFAAALQRARAAVARAPRAPAAHAVLVDALVELGRYEEAVAAAQVMVDLRPDLASYSRVSYIRELHGDVAGAIDAMARAVAAGAPRSEATAWSEVQLGHLHLATGDVASAEAAYREALLRVDGYPHALAGLARVRAARGDLPGAARLYEEVVRVLPLAEHVAALGDVYARVGDRSRADERYAVVETTQRLFAANGVRTDLDLALFDVDHGRDAAGALAAARAEYALRPSAVVASVLAWAELASGDLAAAQRHSAESLRLGWRDPLALYRAGVIADEAGDAPRARELLARASEAVPGPSVLFAPDLAARLARLGAR